MISLLTYPDPRLRQRSTEVSQQDLSEKKLQPLLSDMKEAMLREDGVGIAAPQIGVFHRVIIVQFPNGPEVCINPEILSSSWKTAVDVEGCLSVPGVFGEVRRAKNIRVRYTQLNGSQKEFNAEDFLARVFQHEVDHLNGILFIDKAEKITQGHIPQAKHI